MTATLLAVDDSKTMRKVLEITFAGEDYRMVLANSPADAMAKVRAERPAIALVDALLGGSSGYELCQQLKAEIPQLGVIVLSSKQHPYDRVKGGAVGADDFIDKPYDSQALIDKVTALANKLAAAPAPIARPAAAPHATAPIPTAPGLSPAARPGISPAAAAPTGAAALRTTMAFGSPVAAPAAASPAAASPVRPYQAPAAQPGLGHATTVGLGAAKPAAAAPAAQSPFARPAAPAAHVAPAPQPAAAPIAAAPAVAPSPVAAPVAAAPVAAAPAIPAVSAAALVGASMESKLAAIGLTKDQIISVLALSKDVVEQVVWEVVPVLAETMIREEIKRLTAE